MNPEPKQSANINGALGRRILLVEDDQEIAEEMIADLRSRGYDVCHASTGSEGASSVRSRSFDMLIIDRMLPGIDGLSIIEILRTENTSIPVLIVSALGEVDERVKGLGSGADDYLTKPFSLAEMAARVEALLRRPLQARATVLQAGSLSLDLIDRVARLDGQIIELLPREFQVLEYFMSRPGQIITRDMLIEHVWKYRFSPQTNVIDVHIGKLRRKIDGKRTSGFFQSIRGYGFIFKADA
jgi:two-component system OmpR family response regulator